MDFSKLKADDWLDDLETVGNYAAEKIGSVTKDMPIVKSLGEIATNPTPQEIGAQVYNLGSAISESAREATKDPIGAAVNYGPMGGTIYKGFHQTSKKAAVAIKKEGFRLDIPGARATDLDIPDGVFYKPTNKDINVGTANPNEMAQIPVEADLANPLIVNDRRELNLFMGKLDERIGRLKAESMMREEDAVKQFNKLDKEYSERAKQGGRKATDPELERIFKSQEDVLAQSDTRVKQDGEEIRRLNTEALKSAGYDGVIIKNDEGSFGRSVETIIGFDPKKIIIKAEDFLDQ